MCEGVIKKDLVSTYSPWKVLGIFDNSILLLLSISMLLLYNSKYIFTQYIYVINIILVKKKQVNNYN